jgi:hypothetical protein
MTEPEPVSLQTDGKDATHLASSPANEVAILLVDEVIKGWDVKNQELAETKDNDFVFEWRHIRTETSDLFLEDFVRKAVEVKSPVAEARESKILEELSPTEITSQQEAPSRFEAELEPKDIKEKDLRRSAEADGNYVGEAFRKIAEGSETEEELGMNAAMEHAWLEVVSITSEATAQIEKELKARQEAERAKVSAEARAQAAEARAQAAEARANQAEKRMRQTENDCRVKIEESIARAQAALLANENTQKKVVEIEGGLREMAARVLEAESRRQQAESELQETQRKFEDLESAMKEARARIEIEVNARQEAEQVAAETTVEAQEMVAKAARDEERHKREIASLKAEAEARILEMEAAIKQTEEVHASVLAMMKAEAEEATASARQTEEGYKAEIARMEDAIGSLTQTLAQTEESYKAQIAKIEAEAGARAQETEARARQVEENRLTEIARIRAEADAVSEAACRAEESYKRELAELKAAANTLAIEASQAEERYKTHIAELKAEAEAQARQAEADAREKEEMYRRKVEEAISDAQAAMLTIEEADKKLIESETRYLELETKAHDAEQRRQELETKLQQEEIQRAVVENKIEAITNSASARIELEVKARVEAEQACADAIANLRKTEKIFHAESAKLMAEAEAKFRELESSVQQAQARSRQLYLVSRLSYSLVEQIFLGNRKMMDEKDNLFTPADITMDNRLDGHPFKEIEAGVNGSVDFDDLELSDKLKTLFEALSGTQALGIVGSGHNNGSSLISADGAANEPAIWEPADAIP